MLWDIVILVALIYGNVLLWGGLGVGWDDMTSVIANARVAIASLAQDVALSRPSAETAYPVATAVRSPDPNVRRTPATPSVASAATAAPSFAPTASAAPTKSVLYVSLRDFKNGAWLEQQNPRLAFAIKRLGWIGDGIDGMEAEVIQDLLYIAYVSLPAASSLVSLDWVQDGIDDVEVKGIENLSYIAHEDAVVASSVLSLGWVQDGISEVEVDLIESLAALARDTEVALWIVGMPFLAAIEPPDIVAIMSLRRLAALETEAFARLMSHPALRDGISDDLAHVVATLYGVARTNPDLIDVLLDPARVTLERRAITLPLAGEVILSIIRTSPGAARSMGLLERSVRLAEAYMGSPFPNGYVGLLYADAVFASNAGTNFGTHIAILPKYDIDDGSYEAAYASHINAHEVAHYYWSGNEDWIDEGAAEFMALVINKARLDRPVGASSFPCAYADSIADLENLDVERGDIEFSCNYVLGKRLFADLHRALGEEEFREGFRALYLMSKIEDGASGRRGTSVGIDQIRAAFRSAEKTESVVIDRWYNGTEPYDLSHLDASPADPRLPSISGQIDEAFVAFNKNGPAVFGFSAQDVTDWVYLVLKYSYSVSGDSRRIPLEIVEYYEDGFEFSRRSGEMTAEAKYIGGTRWYSIGPPPAQRWAPGRYWVYVYAGERKVAAVEYQVTP